MKKIFALILSLTATVSLMMISVSAESLEVIEAELPPVDPSQTYEEIIIPEETTPVVTTTVQTTKPVTKPVSKPTLTQKEVKQIAETSVLPTSIALNILEIIK